MMRVRMGGLSAAALLAGTGLSGAQENVLKPFTLDDGKPVLRAQPVERPSATPIPTTPRPSARPAPTPVPFPRVVAPAPSTPRPARAVPIEPPEIPDPTGEIRLAPTGTSMSSDQIQLSIADSYYSKQMFEMAAPEYEKYLGLYPTAGDRPVALFRLAECYRRAGTVNAAKNTYETLLNQFGTGEFAGPAAYRLADLYYQERNFNAALPMYRKASVRLKDPKLIAMAKFYSGRALEGQGNKMDARMMYEELVSTPGDNPFIDASRLSLAILLKDAGRIAEALKQVQVLAKATESAELKAEATVRSGLWQLELNQPKKAADDLAQALQMPGIGRWKDVAQLGLLQLKYNEGKYQEIVDAYSTATGEISAESRPQFLVLAANSHRQLNRHEDALKLYDQLIKEAPNTPFAKDAAYERLVSLYQIDAPNLLAQLEQFLAGNPDASKGDQVLLMKAELLFKAQDFAAAAPLYETVGHSRQLAANYKAKALYKYGWCSLQVKDNEKAIAGFTDLISGYSKDESVGSAYFHRSVARLRSKDLPGALKDLNELIAKFPKAKEREPALEQRAIIQGQQNDNNGMAETYRLLLKDFPKTAAAADANYWIGWVAFENKNYKDVPDALIAAREADKEKYFERASLRILLSYYYLENWDAVGREIDLYSAGAGKGQVPEQVLRGAGAHYYELATKAETPDAQAANYTPAAKYLELLVQRSEAKPDDFLMLGRSQLRLAKFRESMDTLGTYLKNIKEPALRCAGLLAQAEAAIGLRDFDAAQKAVDEALKLQSEGRWNAESRVANGDIQMGRGNSEAAAKLYESVSLIIDDEEITPRALEKAVEAYRKVEREPDAKRLLNTLQSRYPEYAQRRKLKV